MYTSAGLAYYRHADWLGSSRVASTPSRTKYFDVAYAPFGENYADSGTTDYNFTGQNQDTVTGYYDFLFREYSQVHGRWISPDPAGLAAVNIGNPQTWNRYAYVTNNPLLFVDVAGLCASAELRRYRLDLHETRGGEGAGPCYGPGGGGGGCEMMLDSGPVPCDFPIPGESVTSAGPINNWNGWDPWNGQSIPAASFLGLLGSATCIWQMQARETEGGYYDYWYEPSTCFDSGGSSSLTVAANNGNPGTSGCIGKGLQSTFPGSTATMGGSTGEVGGHWNFGVQLQFSSFSAASAFTSTYTLSAAGGWPPPARFGSGPALHLENLGNWSVDNGIYSIGASAHIDLFNPNSGSLGGGGIGGLLGHIFIDGIWGHVVQSFGGNIDPKSCPYR